MAGVAALFTREFFEAARDRLRPGGVLCQWAHTYDISAATICVRLSARSRPSFRMDDVAGRRRRPAAHRRRRRRHRAAAGRRRAWRPAARPRALDESASPATAPLRADVAVRRRSGRDLRAYAGGAPIQTDDRMALEFSAPRGIYGRSAVDDRPPRSARLATGSRRRRSPMPSSAPPT